MRSALDVLADQAAAFSSGPSPSSSPGKGKGRAKGKDKETGRGQAHVQAQQRTMTRTPLAENGTWSSLKPVQWEQEREGSSSPVPDDLEEGLTGSDLALHNRERERLGEGGGEGGGKEVGMSQLERMVLDMLVGAEEQLDVGDDGGGGGADV